MAISTTRIEVDADRKAFVTLRFAGDDLDPAAISAILPITPTRAHKKGEEFFAGPRAGKLRGRTGMWFLATDKLVPSNRVDDHVAFLEKLLYPKTGDNSQVAKLRDVLERTDSRAHITCFWRGEDGESAPALGAILKSAARSLNADIETDFSILGARPTELSQAR